MSVNLSRLSTRCLQYNHNQHHPFSLSLIKTALLNSRSLLRQCNQCHRLSQSQKWLQHSLSPLYNSPTLSRPNRLRHQHKACPTTLQPHQEQICQVQPHSKCRRTSPNQKPRAACHLLEAVAAVAFSVTCQVLAELDKVSLALEESATVPELSISTNSTCKTHRKSSIN